MRELYRRLRWMFRRDEFERDLEEEMRHHLAMKTEDSGEREAVKAFGNVALVKEDSRAAWGFTLLERCALDVRYALRTMRSSRLFTAMAVVSLALGIGANTAIYSFMHAIVLQSLPVQHPEELAVFTWRSSGPTPVIHGLNGTEFSYGSSGAESPNFPFAAWETLRDNSPFTSSLFAYAPTYQLNLVARNQAQVAQGLYVSGNFYSGLGVRPALGRLIGNEDDTVAKARVAVITYNYWRDHFVSDPSAVGQTILINTVPFTVIGVSAPGFFGIDSSIDSAVFIPVHARPLFARNPRDEEKDRFLNRNFYWLEMMGRLRPGVAIAQAQRVFGAMFQHFVESTAASPKEKAILPQLAMERGSGGRDSLRREYEKPLYVLMTMVGLILLIACANIANLLLARATARRREIATRLSLGASRARVIRQLLTESVLLSLSGGIAGVGVAVWGIRSITWLLSNGQEGRMLRAGLDWPVLAFTAALALAAGIVFGLAPAIQATRGNVAPSLKQARIGASGAGRGIGLGHMLVVSQIAISLLLVVAAGLFVRTLENLHSIALGFNQEHLLIFSVNAREAGYTNDGALTRFYSNLADRFRGLPAVRSASLSEIPLAAYYMNNTGFTVPGQPENPAGGRSTCVLRIDESFFATMQIPLLAGRGISQTDIRNPHAAVISELFAKKIFPGGNALGRRIILNDPAADFEIVGIAKNAVYNSIKEEPSPVVYVPFTYDGPGLHAVWFELRTAGDPLKLASTVRDIVHRAAPRVPVTNLNTEAAQIDETISPERTFADLGACFAALALIIACVGLYGTTAYAVARRTSEIGIRMALGAERFGIIWMMLRQVLALAAAGLAIGLAIAWESAHVVRSFLYGVKPQDPVAIWGAAATLLAAAILAAYGPARRAAKVDPMTALRNE